MNSTETVTNFTDKTTNFMEKSTANSTEQYKYKKSLREDNLSVKDKILAPSLSIIQKFYCKYCCIELQLRMSKPFYSTAK